MFASSFDDALTMPDIKRPRKMHYKPEYKITLLNPRDMKSVELEVIMKINISII